jgi:hypothetical protein
LTLGPDFDTNLSFLNQSTAAENTPFPAAIDNTQSQSDRQGAAAVGGTQQYEDNSFHSP